MKTYIKNLFPCLAVALRRRVLPALIAVLNLLPAGRVTAQIFTTLHSFTGADGISIPPSGHFANSGGANPDAGLITNSSGNTLYGTASYGGDGGAGTVFAVQTDGTGFTNLHSFTSLPYCSPGGPCIYANSDGANPQAGLMLSGNTLYGTARLGGSSGNGTVFAVSTDGTGFTNLHSFNGNSDGANPYAGLVLSGNTLYGTAMNGGSSGNGTVFAVSTDGTGFTNLHSFTSTAYSGEPNYSDTNSDGAHPAAGLILAGNTLYGTAGYGGSSGRGTVFAVNTNGTGFTNLHNFTAIPYICIPGEPCTYTNSDGANPYAGLILLGNTLYGTAVGGGSSRNGTVFAVNTDGSGFTNLHSFTATDGYYPYGGLIVSGKILYGTTRQGGSSNNGTVFALDTDGAGFTTLHSFTTTSDPGSSGGTNSDGAFPHAQLVLAGNTLYGTASYGGSSGNGTVFSLSFRPQLTITPAGPNVILSWPTNVAGFDYSGYTLQSTTNLVSPAVWSTNSPAPVVIGGQNTVTHPISGAQRFYRLIH